MALMPTSTWAVPLLALALSPAFVAGQPPDPRQPPALRALEWEISAPSAAPARPAGSEIDAAVAARDYERAERLLAEAVAREPASRDLLLRIAAVFMMDRKPLNAAIALKKAEALGPLDTQSRLQLALAYIAMRRGDWARPELERLVEAEPAEVLYPYWLARLDYDAGQYDAAIRRLETVIARAPMFARAHDNLGLCYEALNQANAAIGHYREAVRLNRLDTATASGWPALNLGILLRTRGDLGEPEALFREALRYDPAFAPAHYQLGALLEQRDQLDAAIQSLRKAAAADARYAEPHYALSRIYRRQGRTSDADAAMAAFTRLRAAGQGPAR